MPGTTLKERLASLRVPPDISTELEVRELVWAFVDERKAAGWTPERVIIAVKQIARESGLRAPRMAVRRDGGLATTDDFLVEMVGWIIDRYFRH
jgi:hypothetical protein